ncbi:MAG TPA: YraN family protein [Candidatus Saccharimonadales bacterium]|nr:YraN family protein [Candidatus Saccharimonadales bacterium]
MTTFDDGRRAEAVAAAFLLQKGCEIIEQNWRTRWCEIDIVARRKDVAYFCEVKYRRTASYGAGLEYITPKKLARMHFAAEAWVYINNWLGECRLCAIEVEGADFNVTQFIDNLDNL